MNDDAVQIKITANSADLTAQIAKAEDALKRLSTSVQGTTSGLAPLNNATAEFIRQYDRAAATLDRSRAAFSHVTDALAANEMSGSQAARVMGLIASEADRAGGAQAKLGHGTAGTTREFIVLGHEVVSGNFSRIPGSLMVLAERSGNLSGIMGALGSTTGMLAIGFAAIAAVLFEVASSSVQANEALNNIQLTMAAMGRGASYSKTSIQQMVVSLHEVTGASRSDLREMYDGVMSIPRAAQTTRDSLVRLGPAFAVVTKKDNKEAVEELSKSFSSFGGLEKLADQFTLFGVSETAAFNDAKKLNDIWKAQDVALAALNRRLLGTQDAYTKASQQSDAFQRFMAGGEIRQAKGRGQGSVAVHPQTGEGPSQDDLKAIDAQSKIAADTQQNVDKLTASWHGAKSDLDATIAQMWADAVAKYKLGGDTLLALQRQQQSAMHTAQDAASHESVQLAAAALAEKTAKSNLSRSQELSAQISSDKELLASTKLTYEDRQQVAHDLMMAEGNLVKEGQRVKMQALQEGLILARAGSQERIAAAEKELQFVTATYGKESAEYKAALKEKQSAQREFAQQQEEISRIRLDSENEVSRIDLQSYKDQLDAKVAAGQMSAARRLQIEQDLTQQMAQQEMERLQNAIAAEQEGGAAYEKLYGQIQVLVARTGQELSKLDAQIAEGLKKSADKDDGQFDKLFQPMGRAFDQMVSGVMMGTQSIQQAMARAGMNMATAFAADILKMIAQEAAFEVFHALAWNKMATAVQADSSKSAMSFIFGKTEETAAVTGATAAQTAAVTTGAATQAAAVTAGQTAQSAAESTGILKHAGSAAAAVYDDVAQIPYVGWMLAPPAAAAAFAAVAAFSAEGGMGNVPYDNAPFYLHKREMVLPASIASPLRTAIQSGSFSGSSSSVSSISGGNHTINVSISGGGNMTAAQLLQNGRAVALSISNELRNLNADLISGLRRAVG